MKIYLNITISFIVIICIYFVLTTVAVVRFQHLYSHLDSVVDEHNVKINVMNQILKLARERSLAIQSMLLTEDPFEHDEYSMKMSSIVGQYLSFREQLHKIPQSSEEITLLKQQHQQTTNTGSIQNKIARLIYDEEYTQARKLLHDDAIPSQEKAMALMEEYIVLQNHLNYQNLSQTKDELKDSRFLMIFTLMIGTLIAIFIAAIVIRRIRLEVTHRNTIESNLEHLIEKRTQQLKHIATHDTLTGLPNRSVFSEQLRQSISKTPENDSGLGLLFMDLDGFKNINDTHGHDVGDKVLVEVSARMKEKVKKTDRVFRLGGDEFVLLIHHSNQKDKVIEIAQRIIKAVDEPFIIDGKTCSLGLSVGISFYPDDTDEPDKLLTQADDLMYQAKSSGKNCYQTSQNNLQFQAKP